MPLYVICPFCQHPTVLPAAQSGHKYRCRQCNGAYLLKISRDRQPARPQSPMAPILPLRAEPA